MVNFIIRSCTHGVNSKFGSATILIISFLFLFLLHIHTKRNFCKMLMILFDQTEITWRDLSFSLCLSSFSCTNHYLRVQKPMLLSFNLGDLFVRCSMSLLLNLGVMLDVPPPQPTKSGTFHCLKDILTFFKHWVI